MGDALGKAENTNREQTVAETPEEEEYLEATLVPLQQVLPQQSPSRAEQVMKALSAAYPDRLGAAEYRDGDWAVPIRDVPGNGITWFYYAEGRLLPDELRGRYAEYDPLPFYSYSLELPPWHDPSEEESARYSNSASRRQANPPKRSQHFYDALWRAHTNDESYQRVKTIRFLGRNVLIHYSIMEELALVEERIQESAKTDSAVRQWIASLDSLSGWNWRNIAATESRSYHAYGAALDLLPVSRKGFETYWLWTAEYNPQWWAVPYTKRLHPPQAVISAFESYGFIWGGKWTFYDTMHFEYRPEILLLNDLPIHGR
ncbi:hypothetical protein FACS1894141_2130 [Spirochaetia bacterium]|nr:hypothetical protein FACS1894141_2130 [Spirochaetia bacterium]